MFRFFADYGAIDEANGTVTLADGDAAHITNTLRLGKGAAIVVCDGAGTDFGCVIESAGARAKTVTARIAGKGANVNEPRYNVTLFQGIPKGGKFDDITRACVELGVCAIVPLITERVVAKNARAERLSAVAEASAKQCGRGIIPKILPAADIAGCVEMSIGADLRLSPWEEESGRTLRSVLRGADKNTKSISLVIGPEGGLAASEVETLQNGGFAPVTLGKRILRTQTAGAAVLAALMYEFEQ